MRETVGMATCSHLDQISYRELPDEIAGCEGDIVVPPADAGHQGENIAAVFVASYTDNPPGETPQTGTDEVILREGQ